MICSRSSSSSRAAALLALAALCAGCAGGSGRDSRVAVVERPRVALFPVRNLSGGAAPVKALGEALRGALAARGLEVVPAEPLDRLLAVHRIRYLGGIDRQAAAVLRDEGKIDGVLVPALEIWSAKRPPRVALTMRLVTTTDPPAIVWTDAVARGGYDSPGLLGLGRVESPDVLARAAVTRLADSLAGAVEGRRRPEGCGGSGSFAPTRAFRSPMLDDPGRRTIAVLPFLNETDRADAGELMVLHFVGQLAATRAFDVVEPGTVRRELLDQRIVLEGGVSLDAATVLLQRLGADLVLSGAVTEFREAAGRDGAPRIEFTAYVLDRRTSEVVWSSASHRQGDEGVVFFGAGRVTSASALACRMARTVVDRMSEARRPGPPAEVRPERLAPEGPRRAQSAADPP